jgi:hypothetical protein
LNAASDRTEIGNALLAFAGTAFLLHAGPGLSGQRRQLAQHVVHCQRAVGSMVDQVSFIPDETEGDIGMRASPMRGTFGNEKLRQIPF